MREHCYSEEASGRRKGEHDRIIVYYYQAVFEQKPKNRPAEKGVGRMV